MDIILPDGTPLSSIPLTTLMHTNVQPYDPVKAHNYYMRTRHLHPRSKGATKETVGSHTPTEASKQLSEQRAYAAQRVSHLRARLAELTAELGKRLSAAQKRKTTSTAASKQKAAAASKKYRQTHKQQIAAKRKQSSGISSMSTAEIKREIINIKQKLQAAVAAQRQLMTNG